MVRLRILGSDLPLADQAGLLRHQVDTAAALKHAEIVFNSAPTGAGKTRAALLCLLELPAGQSAILIAPTNALIDQHHDDAQEFIRKEGLDLAVHKVTAPTLDELIEVAKDSDLDVVWRRGKWFHRFLDKSRAQLIVTNPDIFYAMLFGLYGALDQRNLQVQVLSQFATIIIDEFHYYETKQLFAFECFLLILRSIGAFGRGRKLVLLTATPNQEFLGTIQALGLSVAHITSEGATDSIPAMASARTPFLAPLELELVPNDGGIDGYLQAGGSEKVQTWLAAGLDGVLISNSLAKINRAHRLLIRRGIARGRMHRITGPVPAGERERYEGRQLVLATPTVDIGFNFSRLGKRDRQNIDFVIAEARTREQLLQRIGRAGRLLWNKQSPWPAQAVALVPQDVCTTLRAHDGRELTRAELADLLEESMAGRTGSKGYRRMYGLREAARPLGLMWRQATDDCRPRVQAIFDEAQQLFAPGSKVSLHGLRRDVDNALAAQQFSKRPETKKIPNAWVHEFLRTYALAPLRIDESDAARLAALEEQFAQDPHGLLDSLLAQPDRWVDGKDMFQRFLDERAAVTLGLFAFRDAFSGPAVPLWDPKHYLSESDSCVYNVLHVMQHYECRHLEGQERYGRIGKLEPDLPAFELLDERVPSGRLSLTLDRQHETQRQFEAKLYRVTGISGLRLRIDGSGVDGQQAIDRLLDRAVPALVMPANDRGSAATAGYLRQKGGWTYEFHASLQDRPSVEYEAVLGTAAYGVHADLYWLWRELSGKQAPELDPLWIAE